MTKIKEYINKKRSEFVPLLIAIGGGFLRFFRIAKKSLWVDELGQVFVSSKSIPNIFSEISYHISPPLDYLLLHFTLFLGDSDFIVRLNSALFGTITIFVFYQLTRLLFNTEIAICSSILFSLSRFHIHYSQEARMYSLLCLLATLSFLLLWIYGNNDKEKYLFWLLIVDFALLYTHYYGLFVVIIHGLYLIYRELFVRNWNNRRKRLNKIFRVFMGFLTIGIFYTPWLKIMFAQINRDYTTVATRDPIINFIHRFRTFFIRASWSNWPLSNTQFTVIDRFFAGVSKTLLDIRWPKSFFTPRELIFPLLGLIGLFYYHFSKRKKREIGFLSIWLFLPLLFVMLFNGIWAPRYFIFLLPPYILTIALGIVAIKELSIKKWSNRIGYLWVDVIFTIISIIIASSLINYYFFSKNDTWGDVGKYLEKHTRPNETILVLGGNSAYLEHYYDGPSDVIDADHMYKEPAEIRNMKEFADFVNTDECKWVFISQHTNILFGNVFGSTNITKLDAVKSLIDKNFAKINNVYSVRGYELKDRDLPGLYQSKTCNP